MTVTENTQPADQAGANPEFAAILNQAKDVDSAAHTAIHGESPQAAAVPMAVIDPAAAWAEIPKMVGSMLTMALPELTQVYSKENCMVWGTAMARLAEKRGWDTSGMPPEVSVFVATSVFIIPTTLVIKGRRNAAKQAEKSKELQAADGNAAS